MRITTHNEASYASQWDQMISKFPFLALKGPNKKEWQMRISMTIKLAIFHKYSTMGLNYFFYPICRSLSNFTIRQVFCTSASAYCFILLLSLISCLDQSKAQDLNGIAFAFQIMAGLTMSSDDDVDYLTVKVILKPLKKVQNPQFFDQSNQSNLKI